MRASSFNASAARPSPIASVRSQIGSSARSATLSRTWASVIGRPGPASSAAFSSSLRRRSRCGPTRSTSASAASLASDTPSRFASRRAKATSSRGAVGASHSTNAAGARWNAFTQASRRSTAPAVTTRTAGARASSPATRSGSASVSAFQPPRPPAGSRSHTRRRAAIIGSVRSASASWPTVAASPSRRSRLKSAEPPDRTASRSAASASSRRSGSLPASR